MMYDSFSIIKDFSKVSKHYFKINLKLLQFSINKIFLKLLNIYICINL